MKYIKTNGNQRFRKQRVIDVEDSNVALVGSELDRKVKLSAAQDEPAWSEAGKKVNKRAGFATEGIQIWRIEKFHVVAWPKERYGEFYSGDSYIILYTYKDSSDSNKLLYNVHYWIGNESTQDEYGTAAYKVVELDTLLNDLPVQYRETQGNESLLLRSYFSKIIILNGGVDSGFRRVKPEDYQPRLLHIRQPMSVISSVSRATLKRGSCVYTSEVPLSSNSLNSGDCFIYDAGMDLYQFNGKGSSGLERIKAAQMARAIDDARFGKAEIHVFEEGLDSPDEGVFWEAMGGKKSIPASVTQQNGTTSRRPMKLFRLSDKSGNMLFKEEKGSISKKLDSDDAFIFDSGSTIYVWIGEGASGAERARGVTYAMEYVKDNSLWDKTRVVRIPEGAQHPDFEHLYREFCDA